MLPRHRGQYVIHMVATRAGAGLDFSRPKQRKNLIRIHIYSMRGLELSISTIRIVDIHNSNCRYRQFSAIVNINNWNYRYQQFKCGYQQLLISTIRIVDILSNC